MSRFPVLLAAALIVSRAAAQPASLSGFTDEGAFLVYLDQERAGRLAFRWTADGTFSSNSEIVMGGDTTRFLVKLTPDSEGRWLTATFENELGKTVLERKGREVAITTPGGSGQGRFPQEFLIFDDLSPALIAQALLRYDASKGGRQEFGVLRLGAVEGSELTLERRETSDREIAGHSLRLTLWVYAFKGADLHVLAGPDSRVYLVSGVPWFTGGGSSEQHTFLVREGYEGLRPVETGANYAVRLEPGVKIAMRDGVKLATDLYLPVGVPKAPVILIRSPYGKEGHAMRGYFYAHRGYAVAIQDVRGRFASEGEWEALVHEPKDGYDTIEWLAGQPWSTGKVGMMGGSYLGWVQWLAASLHPPHLATIIPNVSPPDPFHNLPYEYGVVALMGLAPWFAIVEAHQPADSSGAVMAAVDGKPYSELLKVLPLIDADRAILGRESLTWRHWLSHPTADAYWKPLLFLDRMKDIHIPVFHQSAWFDGDGIGSKLNYLAMAGNPSAIQKLTIGPWGHSDTAVRSYRGREFGAAAAIDLQGDYVRWFDHWLKGIDNGILREPLVNVYVMGSNRWLQGSRYPLPETRFEKLYLAGGGGLSFRPPSGDEAADRYVYDPGDPTPSARDLRTPARRDILVYTSPPFDKPYTIAGPIGAVLYAATSARDTDWIVHLVDVDADGRCAELWNNSAGVLRARNRNSVAKAELVQPGKVYRYALDLWQTGVTIAAGHRIRVEVASAAFPAYSRNLNTGGNNETESRFVTASQTIYHDAKRPSHILLPTIPEK